MNGNFEFPMIPRRQDKSTRFVNIAFYFAVGLFLLSLLLPTTREFFLANPLLFFLILAIAYGAKEWVQAQALNDIWQSFAKSTGLTFTRVRARGNPFIKQPQVEGVYRDYPMVIRKFIVSAGEDTIRYTAIEISLNGNHVPRLEIGAKTRLSAVTRALVGEGKQFVQVRVDDDQFDGKLLVKSESEPFAQALLSAEGVRDQLISIESYASDMKIIVQDNKLHYREKNLIKDNAYLLAVTDFLVAFARRIEQTAVR